MHVRLLRCLPLAAVSALALSVFALSEPPAPPESVDQVYRFLQEQMDLFHEKFDVYDDGDSGAAHFFPSLLGGDLQEMKPAEVREVIDTYFPRQLVLGWQRAAGLGGGLLAGQVFADRPLRVTPGPHEGVSCIRLCYPRALARKEDARGWVLVRWVFPDGNLGGRRGHDLSRHCLRDEKVELSFWARGETGNEYAEFLVGGVNRTPHDDPSVPGKDSVDRLTTGVVRLNTRWTRYSLPLQGEDTSNLIGGFGWSASRLYNPDGCVVHVDSVQIRFGERGRKRRLDEPRFIRSYVPERPDEPDGHFRNVCYIYDNALALLAFLARGTEDDRRRARILADAFVYAQDHDRTARDGRLRNAYMPATLWAGPRGAPARLPGRWDQEQGKWIEDEYLVSTDAGNLAWVMLALLGYWEQLPEAEKPRSPHLNAALRLGRWIQRHCHAGDRVGGYTGGVEGWAGAPGGQRKVGWKSTEHNIDLYSAFLRLHQARRFLATRPDDPDWARCALHARAFVERMWNDREGHFWTGTEPDGLTVNARPVPLDPAPWAALSFRTARYARALDWAEKHSLVSPCPVDPGAHGYAFSNVGGGVWWEGTAQMALAQKMLGQSLPAGRTLGWLRSGLAPQGGVLASSRDRLPTGFEKSWGEWVYYRRRHVGASSWWLFARLGWNPYWSEPIRPVSR